MGTSRRAASVASCAALLILSSSLAWAALTVPTDVQQPGTQPGQAGTLESPDKCDNCHGNYNRAVEPAFNWRGSMMANAGRDPLFWATLAIAEQDFDGVGDLCIRCHSTAGWQAGRSTPTDGSGLTASDADGVECEACHKSTNTNDREHLGAQSQPFVANDGFGTGYYGSGMLSLWPGAAKLGPYANADARHQFLPSKFHRDAAFCGTCHDVSNPAVGNLAHNNGRQSTSDEVVADGTPGGAVDGKAAFNNLPFRYGVVERTFSEFMSGSLGTTRVSAYASLPAELKAGAIKAAYESAKGDYVDGAPRYFSCQTCHMRAVTGQGCNKAGVLTRTDLPLHDMTGGNYWAPDAIRFQNTNGTLRLGGAMTAVQLDALTAGKTRALQQLALAASLTVTGNTLKIVNLTGHKLISGYPEGRRMWVNAQWFDASGALLREDGRYGELKDASTGAWVVANGTRVRTLLDPSDPNTKVYEAHYGMTQQWAQQLLSLNYAPTMPLTFDRLTGAVEHTLGELAGGTLGAQVETFHFVLNNVVVKDNRIPPYGFSYEEARRRNALPVPASQYGGVAGGTYQHYDTLGLNPPAGASYATLRLMYQPTSWEYVQFLVRANKKSNVFLANEGDRLLDAWLATSQAEPQVMASTTWGAPPAPACTAPGTPQALTALAARKAITLNWKAGSPASNGGYRVYYNQSGKVVFRGAVPAGTLTYKDANLTSRVAYTYVVTAWQDCNGNGSFDAGVDMESPVSNTVTATAG
jgi:hypothetical protein